MKKKSFLLFVILCCITLLAACVFVACNPDSGEQTGQPGEGDGGKDETMFFTVTFDTQGGSKIADIKVESGHIVGEFTIPTKQCSRLVGFALDADGERMWDILTDKVSADITLYAIWEDAHDWGEWGVTTPATCTEDGEKTRTCNACGETEKEVVPAAHTWGEWETVTNPTCTTDGTQKRVCEACGEEETGSIPALGHDFAEEYTVDVAPNCETTGSESRHCTRCEATTDSREIAALGHDYEGAEWHYNDANHWQCCTRCGKEYEREPHSYDSDGVCECGMMITPVGEFLFTSLGNNTWRLDKYTGSRTNVYIPSMYNNGTVIEINEEAFSGNTSMQTLVIPDTVTSIGARAFSGCVNLTSVTVSKNLTSIGEDAFDGCAQITNATIPTIAIDYIPQNNITTVILTGGTKISAWAFENCTGLKSITISESVTSIGIYAFYGCTGLTEINWNAVSVADLNSSSNAFYNAGTAGEGITVTFGESVQKIPAYLFYVEDSSYCPNIKSVTISDSVTSIGGYAFYDCTGLTEINWNAIFVGDFSSGSNVFYNAGTAGSGITVTFGDSVKTIPARLFDVSSSYYRPNIKSVTIGNGVTSIGSSAFSGCSRLTSITIPDGVTSIGNYAFSGCSRLTSVTIGDSVTSIGRSAFDGCSGLTEINWNAVSVSDIPPPSSSSSNYVFYNAGTAGDGITVIFGDSVQRIPAYLFYVSSSSYRPNIKSVTIGNSVTSIGERAFYECSGLTSVTMGNSVTSIGKQAFYGCSGLTSITIPDSVTSIGQSAFSDCSGLTSVTIGNSVTSIGQSAFSDCSGLTSVTIGNSVTSIGTWAFADCSGLTSITIPDSVTSIGERAFYGCSGLTSIIIPGSVTSIGDYAFYNCSGLKSVTIGNGVTSIGGYAFSGCSGLTSITIPDSVTDIESYAFYNVTGLKSITIPESVSSIGASTFSGCTRLRSIYYTSDMASWFGKTWRNIVMSSGRALYIDGNKVEGKITIPDGVEIVPSNAFAYQTGITHIIIPDSVTGIESYAFYKLTGLTSVTMGRGVSSIEEYAFSGCTGLTEINWNAIFVGDFSSGSNVFYNAGTAGDGITVTFGDSVRKIPKYLFYVEDSSYRPNITSVTIGNSVTSIGWDAFSGCSGLTSITIPDSVTSIGSDAFSGCSSLEAITIPFVGEEAGKTSSDTYQYPFGYIFGTSSYTGGTAVEQRYYGSSSSTKYSTYYIPSSLRSVTVTGGNILYGAFYNCSMLTSTSVTIGNSVTSIGDYAFEDCSRLTSIIIPDSVTRIGYSAFYGTAWYDSQSDGLVYAGKVAYKYKGTMPNNTSIVLREGTLGIADYAFYGSGLTSITIPDSVTSIGERAFYYCSGLTSITIPDSVTSIGESAFAYCSGLASITIGNGVTSIGNYAFSDCSGLTSVTIGNSVTSIGYSAFYNCSGLTSITIPDSVTSIGRYAFSDCSGLTSVTFENTNRWQVSKSSSFSSYTALSSDDLFDASTAATYLKSTYYGYYWRRV